MAPASPWNSLEIVKLVLSCATPLMVLAMGILITRQQTRQTDRLARLTALLTKRVEIWDAVGPILIALEVALRPENPNLKAARAQIEAARRQWVPFVSYFPPRFNLAMENYLQDLLAVLDGKRSHDRKRINVLLNELRNAVLSAIGGRDVTDDPELGPMG